MIELNVRAKDWRDSIRASGELLVKNQYAEPRYIQAMIDTVEEFGPYIVLFKGFALGHARSDMGALKTGLSFISLEEPVEFGHEENDPVRIVACMSAVDSDSHLSMLSELAEIMSDENIIDDLSNSKDINEFLEKLRGEKHGISK